MDAVGMQRWPQTQTLAGGRRAAGGNRSGGGRESGWRGWLCIAAAARGVNRGRQGLKRAHLLDLARQAGRQSGLPGRRRHLGYARTDRSPLRSRHTAASCRASCKVKASSWSPGLSRTIKTAVLDQCALGRQGLERGNALPAVSFMSALALSTGNSRLHDLDVHISAILLHRKRQPKHCRLQEQAALAAPSCRTLAAVS